MKILALEGYYGGSHRAFLDGWADMSRHEWAVLTLAASKWKWRMRHGAITFAEKVDGLLKDGFRPDVLFCSDMLNLAEFLGLADESLRSIPTVVYFHENQLTYPVRFESERDYQYVMTNLTTALAATAVWFNSAFGRDEFLGALEKFLRRMPDNQPLDAIEKIRAKSVIFPPGINEPLDRSQRKPGPMRILWAARWEHDKNPDDLFEALKDLKADNIDFRLSVIGQQFRDGPEVFDRAKTFFADNIDRWGYLPGRAEYEAALLDADLVVSTADHEFFGISIAEAIASGAYPVLPNRLAYPEIVNDIETETAGEFFYDGTIEGLTRKLAALAGSIENGTLWAGKPDRGRQAMRKYYWQNAATAMDDALETLEEQSR